jgi:hypothetical protein
MLELVRRDGEYLEDLIIDLQVGLPQVMVKEMKEMVDKSRSNFQEFRRMLSQLLQELLKLRGSVLQPDDRQNLITICYIKSGIDILANYENYLRDAIHLEKYPRSIETEDTKSLFAKVTGTFLDKELDFTLDLGEEDV